MQVEAILDRINGEEPAIKYITERLQELGYASWAHRVVNTAGAYHPDRGCTDLQTYHSRMATTKYEILTCFRTLLVTRALERT